MRRVSYKQRGVSLLEVLLVLTILSSMIYMGLNYYQQKILETTIARITKQMNTLLLAESAYYVANKKFAGATTLKNEGYIVDSDLISPFQRFYQIAADSKKAQVTLRLTASYTSQYRSIATIIAGRVPSATAFCPDAFNCYVIAYASIPSQVSNSSVGMNYAGLYHHGACIPVPDCKVGGTEMKPQVFVVPVSVSGLTDDQGRVVPISSFTAYATYDVNTKSLPPNCLYGVQKACGIEAGQTETENGYARACLQVTTLKGNPVIVNPSLNWGEKVVLAAFTRCAPNADSPNDSGFNVFSD